MVKESNRLVKESLKETHKGSLGGNNKIWFAQMMRGIAALMVVYSHLFVCRVWWIGQYEIHDPFLGDIHPENYFEKFYDFLAQQLFINLGAVGVGVFYIISGFVISFSISKRERLKFLLNRIARIFPVVIAALIVDYAVLSAYHVIWTDSNNLPSLRDYLVNAFLLLRPILGLPFVNGVLWTLEIEFVFYLIIVLLGRKIVSLRVLLVFYLGLFVLWWLDNRFCSPDMPVTVFVRNSIPHIYTMFCGVFFFNLYNGTLKGKFFGGGGCVAIMVPLMLSLYLNYRNFPNNPELYLSYSLIPMALFTLAYVCREKLKRSEVLNFFANISFSLYLAHQMVGYAIVGFLVHLGFDIYICILVAFALVLCYSYILNKFVERKAQLISKKF